MSGKNTLFIPWMILLLAGIAVGLGTAGILLVNGHYLFNANDVLIWTLPLGAYVFLALTSTGLALVSSMPLVFNLEQYEGLAKRLVFLLAKLWRMHKGDWHSASSRFLGIASMLTGVFAALMLGSVFGLTEARPTYFGPFISVFCLVIALLSGMAMIILYINICSLIKRSCSQVTDTAMNMLARKFSFVIGLTLIFYFLKLAMASGSTYPEFATAINFSLILFLVVPYVLMISPGLRRTAWAKTLASAVTLIGIFAVHMQILIGGQVRPVGPKAEGLPEILTYFPSIWEILVVVFALCVMLLLYTLGERFLRLDDTPHGQSA